MNKLKPCPFCGGEAFLHTIEPHEHIFVDLPPYEGGAFVECTKCSCGISGDTKEEAVLTWNTRKPIDKVVEQLEAKMSGAIFEKATQECNESYLTGLIKGYSEAIEIVKGGAE